MSIDQLLLINLLINKKSSKLMEMSMRRIYFLKEYNKYFGDKETTKEVKKIIIKTLTQSSRFCASTSKLKDEFRWPVINSNTKTPQLNTSAFTDRFPCITYSGAIYPLYNSQVLVLLFYEKRKSISINQSKHLTNHIDAR